MEQKTAVILTTIILLTSMRVASAIYISQVLYDPEGSDNNKEFVEVAGTDTLEGFRIGDRVMNDTLRPLLVVNGSGYTLIVEEGYNTSGLNCSIFTPGATIGDDLNNDGDVVYLYKDGNLVDSMSYDGTVGHGTGLELADGAWRAATRPHPCMPPEGGNLRENATNNGTAGAPVNMTDVVLAAILDDVIYEGVPQDSLFRITNENHEKEGKVDVRVEYDVKDWNGTVVGGGMFNKTVNSYASALTGGFTPQALGRMTLCGRITWTSIPDNDPENDRSCKDFLVKDPYEVACSVSLNLSLDKEIVASGEQVSIMQSVSDDAFPFEITYRIVDVFGREWKNLSTKNALPKSFTPKIDRELDVIFVENRLSFVACNNSAKQLSNRKMVVVKGEEKASQSSISITDVGAGKDGTARFGSTIRPAISIYKGDTAKSAVTVWAEREGKKASKVTSIRVEERRTAVDITVPLALSCDEDLLEGWYEVVAVGLGEEAGERFTIEGSACGGGGKKTAAQKGATRNSTARNSTGKTTERTSILSFYTLTRKFEEGKTARFFGRVEGKGPLAVRFFLGQANGSREVQRMDIPDATRPVHVDANLTLLAGEQDVVLEVEGEGGTEKKAIRVNATAKEMEKRSAMPVAKAVKGRGSAPVAEQEMAARTQAQATGFTVAEAAKTVYGGKTGRVTKYLNYAIAFLFVAGAVLLWVGFRGQGRDKGSSGQGLHPRARHVRGLGLAEEPCGDGYQGVRKEDQERPASPGHKGRVR